MTTPYDNTASPTPYDARYGTQHDAPYDTAGSSDDPDAIRREIERTQSRLSGDVDALTEKVTPSRVVQRRVDRVRGRVSGWRDAVMGSDPAGSARDTAHQAAGTARSLAGEASDRAGSVAGTVGDRASEAAST